MDRTMAALVSCFPLGGTVLKLVPAGGSCGWWWWSWMTCVATTMWMSDGGVATKVAVVDSPACPQGSCGLFGAVESELHGGEVRVATMTGTG